MNKTFGFSPLTPESLYELDSGNHVFSPEHFQSIHYAVPEDMISFVLQQEIIRDAEYIDKVIDYMPLDKILKRPFERGE